MLSSENDWILYRLDDLAQIKSGYSGTQVSYQTPYKVSRIETISKHCIDIQRIGYVECIPESYRLNVGNILFSNINSIQYIGNTAYLDKDYGNAKIFCPPLSEQKRIANVLGKLESKLCLEQNILASFNLQKRYLLGQMFI